MTWLKRLVAMTVVLTGGGGMADASEFAPWAVYYDSQLPADRFFDYRLVAFDADHHPPLEPLNSRGIVVLGYMSLGEVENYRRGFEQAKADGYVLMENENWPGSFFVDLRDPRWHRRIVHDLAAQIMQDGFDGFILDTLDNAAELERRDPVKYAGMLAAAAGLIRQLRETYPDAKIMLNRAFELHDRTAKELDFILAESIYAEYDGATSAYVRVADDVYHTYLKKLNSAKRANPLLTLMSLDYWDPQDSAMIRQIYAVQRQNGLKPYVSVPSLNRLVPEPPR